jgi:hypothetical protein
MKKYAFINQTTGEVASIHTPVNTPSTWQDGAVLDGFLLKELPLTAVNGVYVHQKFWHDSQWKDRPARPSYEYDWVNFDWAINTTKMWARIRGERSNRLAASDWTQLGDITFPTGTEAVWADYRQALRDIPTAQANVTSYDDVVWPTEPT